MIFGWIIHTALGFFSSSPLQLLFTNPPSFPGPDGKDKTVSKDKDTGWSKEVCVLDMFVCVCFS